MFFPAVGLLVFLGFTPWIGLALGCVSALTAQPATAVVYRRTVRERLRTELHYYGVRVCIECGHRLGENESRTCPECGAATLGRRSPPH